MLSLHVPRTIRRHTGVLAIALTLSSCASRHPVPQVPAFADAAARFEHEWDRVAEGNAELRIQLASRPMAFFRFINRAWTREVCDAFASESASLPSARLHGDAHIEQYAVTADARGLDDFDDSSSGPAVVDITRFLGSLELAAAQRGWMASLPEITDAFFAGYRKALDDPAYLPPDPAVVARTRASSGKTMSEFLVWADAMMEPLSAGAQHQLDRSWPKVEAFAAKSNPEFTTGFLHRKAVGWLHMGIGSALTPKILIRIEGPTTDSGDDLVLEAKEVGPFEAGSCVSIPRRTEALRVVEGIQQIGRLPQRLLLALPELGGTTKDARGWWVKAWDWSFAELDIADFASAEELRDVSHDVGAQLGSSNLVELSGRRRGGPRQRELQAIVRLKLRIQQVAHELTLAVIEAWTRGK